VGKISAVINVVKEELIFLPRALSSLRNLADEVVLVDMTDGGALEKIVKDNKVKTFKHEKVPYVEIARNFGISKTKSDWVLVLDPDEELSVGLVEKLKSISLASTSFDYYRIPRKNIIFGKWIKHSRWWPDYNIRFFKKGFVSWSEVIHQVPFTKGTGLDLEAKEENAIIHHHYETVDQYLERMNRYTTALSQNLVDKGYKFDWRDLVEKPINEFLSRFFQGEGYKDGLHGFVLSLLQGFSEFVVYLKVWQKEKFKSEDFKLKEVISEMRKAESDLHYWQSDALLKEVGGLKYRIKRKFKI